MSTSDVPNLSVYFYFQTTRQDRTNIDKKSISIGNNRVFFMNKETSPQTGTSLF
jgi:hypothetical protein